MNGLDPKFKEKYIKIMLESCLEDYLEFKNVLQVLQDAGYLKFELTEAGKEAISRLISKEEKRP